MGRVKIRYTIRNPKTFSYYCGTMMANGNNFHEVSDSLTALITERIPSILKSKLPGENPEEWSVGSFQDWKEWHSRVRRAREAMDGTAS